MTESSNRVALWFAALLTLGGCASSPPPSSGPGPGRLGRDLPAFVAPARPDAGGPAFPEEPSGPITLRDALALALLRSPRLVASAWDVRAEEARSLQAGLRPNPELGVELEDFAGPGDLAGFDGSEITVSLSQLLELGGKRAKRLRVARLGRDLAAWDYETRRMDVLTETTKAFVTVLAAQERVLLAEDLVSVADRVLASVKARVKAGATSPVEESRARVALATSRVELEIARRNLTVARTRLAATWGGAGARFSEAVGDLGRTGRLPPLTDLLDRIENNPDLARWTAELDQRRAALALERARGVPDLSVGAGLRHIRELDGNSLVAEVSIPFPLFDRNQGSIREAHNRLAQAEAQHRAAKTATRAELSASYENLAAVFDEIAALRDEIIPEARRSFEGAKEAYQKGLFRFTDVLDTHRTLFELRGRHFDALARYHQIRAEVERLVGEPLESSPPENGRP